MTRDEELDALERKRHRDLRVRRVLVVLSILTAVVAVAWALTQATINDRRLDALRSDKADADTAAVDIAQEKQDQARTIADLCASGEVDQSTERGKAACQEASEDASVDPVERVEAVKGAPGARGPQGPQGIAGADGEDGTEGTDGEDGPAGAAGGPGTAGEPGAAGEDGADGATGPAGADGQDGESVRGEKGDPGPAGPAGVDGKDGADSTVPGPQGEPGTDGSDGQDGRGLTDAQCDPATGRWTLTWTDDTTTDGGPCLATTEAPETPEPEPTEEVNP